MGKNVQVMSIPSPSPMKIWNPIAAPRLLSAVRVLSSPDPINKLAHAVHSCGRYLPDLAIESPEITPNGTSEYARPNASTPDVVGLANLDASK